MSDVRDVERILKATANARRLAILLHLRKSKSATVGAIAEKIHLSFKATSKHLHVLDGAKIVGREQISLNVYYRLEEPMHTVVRAALSIL